MVDMDYMFMTTKPDKEHLVYPIIVMTDFQSGGIWTIPTNRNRPSGINVVERMVEVINGLGYSKVVLNPDQYFSLIYSS